MKLALVDPPKYVSPTNHMSAVATPPLGLAYLAAAARAVGHQVAIVDAVGAAISTFTPFGPVHLRGLENRKVVERIPADVDVIGLGCMFSCQWPAVRLLIGDIKRRFPDVPLVFGGEHPTGLPEMSLRDSAADVVVLGEGEETLTGLLGVLATGKPLASLAGIAYRDGEQVVMTARRARITRIDDIPWPAWDLVAVEAYMDYNRPHGAARGRFMPMLATRGCPYECTFCTNPAMWTQRWVARDPRNVVDEIEHYVARYDASAFHFEDLTAIVRRDWIERFCEEILQRRLQVSWQLPSGTRSEAIDGDVARLMKAAGCHEFAYAPESGSPRTLKLIKKRVSLDRLYESAQTAMQAGVSVGCFFILGFPHEAFRDVALTYRAIARCALRGFATVNINAFSPQPNTALYRELLAAGGITLDDAYFYSLFTYQDLFRRKKSWNPRIGDRTLTVLIWLGYALFFGLSFARRPSRAFVNVADLFRSRSSTKLGNYLRAMLSDSWRLLRSRK
jgi:anaerobic magnesium-protoporphyrin IX monomethyl ester cyclase